MFDHIFNLGLPALAFHWGCDTTLQVLMEMGSYVIHRLRVDVKGDCLCNKHGFYNIVAINR